jgi:mRNA interferase RelE/StbE
MYRGESRERVSMSWKIEVKPTAEKQYLKLDNTTRRRIKKALLELEQAENPLFHHAVKQLMGKLEGDYRLRIGDWRVLFTPDKVEKVIYVYTILPRGDAY